MRSPFAKPRTTEQWLLGSICWAVACLGGWWAIAYALGQWPRTEGYTFFFAPFGFVTAHWLLWRKAVCQGWQLAGYEDAYTAWWLKTGAYLWFGILILFQIASLATMVMLFVWTH